MATRLADRDTVNSICGYYVDTLGNVTTVQCDFNVPCTIEQYMTPKVAFCSQSGAVPATSCVAGEKVPASGCSRGQICCTTPGRNACGEYLFNGGSTVMLGCFPASSPTTIPSTAASLPSTALHTSASWSAATSPRSISASVAPSITIALLTSIPLSAASQTTTPTADLGDQSLPPATDVALGICGAVAAVGLLLIYYMRKRESTEAEGGGGGSVHVPPNAVAFERGQKLLNYRVENIAESVGWDDVMHLFKSEDRPWIQVRSLAPARFFSLGQRYKTATIEFICQPRSPNRAPRLDQPPPLVVDKTFEGFTPLNDPKEPVVADIIAVTGLAGHAFGSWAHSAKGMWLRDDLPSAVPNVRMITYGYPSSLQGSSSYSSFDGHAGNFTVRLREHIMQTEARPTILMGHSLGCLLIKQAVITLMDNWESSDTAGRPFSELIPQIIFFGAPHNGLNTDALRTLVGGQPSAPLIQDLTPGSGVLVNLNNRFAEKLMREGRDIKILSVVEVRKTKTVVQHRDGSWTRNGPETLMVPKSSAMLGYSKETVLESDEDHSRIAKLYSSEGNVYYDVLQTIITCVRT